MKDILFIDMDDTMCEFATAHAIALAKEPGIKYPQSQFKFFENLEPIDGAIDAYWRLKEKYDVLILTRPSICNPLSYTEKRIWVEKHLGFGECDRLVESCDKTIQIGKYLIDDMPQTGRLVPVWELVQIWSSRFPSWKSVLDYLI